MIMIQGAARESERRPPLLCRGVFAWGTAINATRKKVGGAGGALE